MRFIILSLFLATSAHAQMMFDQGAPGTQGPWPVYIQLLPDGGGGNNTVPCPFSVLDGGNTVFNVDCLGVITPSVTTTSLPCGTIVTLVDGGTLLTEACNNGALTTKYTLPDAGTPSVALNPRSGLASGNPALIATLGDNATSAVLSFDGTNWDMTRALDTTVGGVEEVVSFKNGGGWVGTKSNHDFYIGAHDEFGAIGMSAAGGITVYDSISFNNHELTSIGAAGAGGSAAQLNQVQADLSLVGMTLPGLSPANNLVIGSATGASGISYSLARYRINLTCLVAGVGAGTTTIALKDATAVTTLVTASESCACTPGAVVSAISTGSSTDSDQFNIALSASASTDCATFPLFIANANLSRK